MERNFVGILCLFGLLGKCFRVDVMTEKVVTLSGVINLFEEKQKRASVFSLEQASADVAAYEDIVNKSILEFSSYSVFEKQELYTTLAKFNVELLQKLLAIKKENSFD